MLCCIVDTVVFEEHPRPHQAVIWWHVIQTVHDTYRQLMKACDKQAAGDG